MHPIVQYDLFFIRYASTVLLIAPFHANPSSTNTDFLLHDLDADHPINHLIALATLTTEPFLLSDCSARRETVDIPPLTAGPEAPSRVFGSEQSHQGTANLDPAATEGAESYELVDWL